LGRSNQLTAIYTLSGPDGAVRYIGKTVNPKSRLAAHASPSQSESAGRPVVSWVVDWEEAECRWIAEYRANGVDLLNIAAGGLDMAHVYAERGKYPAYAWMVQFFARAGHKDTYGVGLRAKAAEIKATQGAEGMRVFNEHLRQLLRETFPLCLGAR
jgi:hypothetical protein